jgi:amino acid adenylation domain-containing protein
VLGQLTARQDVVFGTVVAGRPAEIAGIETMVGLFINTLPVRAALDPRQSLAELFRALQNTHSELIGSQHLSLTEIQRPAGLGESFDTLFVFENYPLDRSALTKPFADGLRFTDAESHDATHYALSLLAVPGQRLSFRLQYRTDLFEYRSAEAIGNRLLRLLEAIAEDPSQRIGSIELLTTEEHHEILSQWNATAQTVPQSALPALFEAQVDRTPEATALIFEESALSYAELNRRANRLAHLLISRGVGPETVVGLAVPRSVEMVVGLLGVLKAGAAYLPLDPDYPAKRLAFMLQDAQPTCVLTTSKISEQLPLNVPRLVVDDSHTIAALAEIPDANPSDADRVQPLKLNNAAYIIYTSGSTGSPKGVVVTFGGLTNLLFAMQEHFGLDQHDRLLAVTTISFDMAVPELYLPLLNGARLQMATKQCVQDPAALARMIRRSGTTILQATPTLWDALMTSNAEDIRTLRKLTGAEPLPNKLARNLWDLGGRLTNLYGPTETTVWSTAMIIKEPATESAFVGRPIWNTRIYVLDGNLQPVPVGVAGDVYIAGAGLARGYFKRPALSAERFVADPFGEPGSRMYRSGDMARWRADGELEFLGRGDQQLKIRGFRIEPAEIEAALLRHPSVAHAAVIGREGREGDKRLVGYVVAKEEENADAAGLRNYLSQQLPEYMVPAAVVVLDGLPLTPNGKLDRKALPAPDFAVSGAGADKRGPRTAQEEILCSLFAETLDLPRVSIDDNFFELGGHSLLATRLISRIRSRLNVDLPVRALFTAPTVARLTEGIDVDAKDSAIGVVLPLRTGGHLPPLFCIHPAGGLSWCYAGLQQYLDGPIYGLQARAFEQPESFPPTFEALVDDYVAEIRAIQPAGPYHLLGWSFGGLAAYSIAARLRILGEQVALLALLDSYPPDQESSPYIPDEQEIIRAHLEASGYEATSPGDEPLKLSTVKELLLRDGHLLANLDDQQLSAVPKVYKNNIRISAGFVPARFDGDLLFFAATQETPEAPKVGWERYVRGRIMTYKLACSHGQMTQPSPLAEIGRVVAAELEKERNGRENSGQANQPSNQTPKDP